jgi:hypothetical protein
MNRGWPNPRGRRRSTRPRGRSWKSCRDQAENRFSHQNAMLVGTQFDKPSPIGYYLREPSEPSPPPIREPPNPPENPDAPVREPDPDDPDQI